MIQPGSDSITMRLRGDMRTHPSETSIMLKRMIYLDQDSILMAVWEDLH